METADILTMILVGLIVAACWVVVPGLITGWLLRESGRSFWWGFVLGAVCGAVGVLAAVVFVSVADRKGGARARRRPARAHYDVPLLGRLHASTAWTLAGLATFMCVWVLGGIGYEVFYRFPRGDEANLSSGATRGGGDSANAMTDGAARASDGTSVEQRAANNTASRNDAETQGRPAVLGQFNAQPARGGQLSARTSPVAAPPSASLEGVELTGVAPLPQPSALSARATAADANATGYDAAAPPPPKPATPSRAAIISELTSSLAARGYRAHAAVSGDARTSTLSISCATLSRAAGNQLLGNSRTLEALRASGIRIVVVVNGEESWTYML